MNRPSPSKLYRLHHQWWALEAFANHELLESTYWNDGRGARWVVGRPNDSAYKTEIIAGLGGSLIVHGDIDLVRFAHYGDKSDAISRLYWMGFCSDLDYYVLQKADIGGAGKVKVEKYCKDVAEQELRAMIEDPQEEAEHVAAIKELLDDGVTDSREELLNAVYGSGCFDVDCMVDIGMVVDPSVIYAHAALNRCASLVHQIQATLP